MCAKKGRTLQKLKFSIDQEKLLIQFMKKNSFLWDVYSNDYKNGVKKKQKWKELAQLLGGKDVDQVKKRWRNIRDYENSKKNPARKRTKKLSVCPTSEEDSNQTDKDDNSRVDGEDMSIMTQQSTIGNFLDIKFEVVNADTVSEKIIDEETVNDPQALLISPDECAASQQSLIPQMPKQPNDDVYNAIMRQQTNVLQGMASASSSLNVTYNRESNGKSIMQLYFEVFSAEIALLPIELQTKCQREVKLAVTTIIHEFQDQAEEMQKATYE